MSESSKQTDPSNRTSAPDPESDPHEQTVVGHVPEDATFVGDGSPSDPTSDGDELRGEFGRYRIERRLGRGAMGEVYLAHDTQLDRPVALKVPTFAPGSSPTLPERFQREARAAAVLTHPNICSVYDVGELDGRPFISMQYVEGRPLSDYVTSKAQLPFRQVARVVRRIALAIAEAHEKGILHRDIKPANVMVDHRNEPIVMDFGLAHCTEDESAARLTREGAVVGTPAYMAPEQLDGSQTLDTSIDVYALGVVLYELLTGRIPFTGDFHAIIGQILSKDPTAIEELREDVPPELAAICRHAMAKQPGERYESMRDFAKDLAAFMKGDGASISAELPPPPPEPAEAFDGAVSEWGDLSTQQVVPPKTRRKSKRKKSNTKRRNKSDARSIGMMIGGGAAIVAIVVGSVLVIRNLGGSPEAEDTNPPNASAAAGVDPEAEKSVAQANRPETNDDEEPLDPKEVLAALDPPDASRGAAETEPTDPPTPQPTDDDTARPDLANLPRLPGPGRKIDAPTLFEDFDRNRDSFLDAGELPAHIVQRADGNDDGKLSLNELRRGLQAQGRKLLDPPRRGEKPPPPFGVRPPKPRPR